MQLISSSLASALDMRTTSSAPFHGVPLYQTPNGSNLQAVPTSFTPHHMLQTTTPDAGPFHDGMARPAIPPLQSNQAIPLKRGLTQPSHPIFRSQDIQSGFGPHSQVPILSRPNPTSTLGALSIDLTQGSPPARNAPNLPTKVPDVTRPAVKPKKKKKRPLPSIILAKDIEELNRKRFIQQDTREPVKTEPLEPTEVIEETASSSKALDPLLASREEISQAVHPPANDFAGAEIQILPETPSLNDVSVPPLAQPQVPIPFTVEASNSVTPPHQNLPQELAGPEAHSDALPTVSLRYLSTLGSGIAHHKLPTGRPGCRQWECNSRACRGC
jgi:hypothetical protein